MLPAETVNRFEVGECRCLITSLLCDLCPHCELMRLAPTSLEYVVTAIDRDTGTVTYELKDPDAPR